MDTGVARMKSSLRNICAIFSIIFTLTGFSYVSPLNAKTQIDLDSLQEIVTENVTQVKTLDTISLPMVDYSVAPILCFAFSPIDTSVAYTSPSDSSQISIWDFARGENLIDLSISRSEGTEDYVYVNDLAFSPDGKSLISGNSDRTVRLWDVKNGSQDVMVTLDNISFIDRVAFAPDGKSIAYAIGNNIGILDIKTKVESFSLTAQHNVSDVMFDPNGSSIIYSDGLGDSAGIPVITIFSFGSNKALLTLEGHNWQIEDLALSSNGELLASSSDETIRVWKISTGEAVLQLKSDYPPVASIAFNSDGSLLATGASDGTITIWDTLSGKRMMQLYGHSDAITRVRFDPTGKLIGSSSKDGTIRFWGVSP